MWQKAPDGYSFVIITGNQSINETLQPRRPFVLLRDLVPVAAVNRLWLVFAVSNALPARSFVEFLAHARANPGRINYASSGPGSIFHLAAEMLRHRAGLEMVHVPFRQYSEARTQLLAGEIQLMADAVFTLDPLIRRRADARHRHHRPHAQPPAPRFADGGRDLPGLRDRPVERAFLRRPGRLGRSCGG